MLPAWDHYFFLVQITREDAPPWLAVLDELPSLLLLAVLSVVVLTWCVAPSAEKVRSGTGAFKTFLLPLSRGTHRGVHDDHAS